MSNESQQQIHAAAAALRETAATMDDWAKTMAEEPEQSRYPVVVPSLEGHRLKISEDGAIILTPPGIAPFGEEGFNPEAHYWYWASPSVLWDTLESMAQQSQPEDGGDPEADELLNQFREFIHRRAAPQAPAGEPAEAGHSSEESVIRADDPHPEVAVHQQEDHPGAQERQYREGLPVDADGRFILVEDPEELDLAESIADQVAKEQLRDGLANADLGMIELYRNQVKKLKGTLPPDPSGGEASQDGTAKS